MRGQSDNEYSINKKHSSGIKKTVSNERKRRLGKGQQQQGGRPQDHERMLATNYQKDLGQGEYAVG